MKSCYYLCSSIICIVGELHTNEALWNYHIIGLIDRLSKNQHPNGFTQWILNLKQPNSQNNKTNHG